MRLTEVPVGRRVRLRAAAADASALIRLREIGIHPGATGIVVQRTGFGGRVLALGAGRVAVDAETARSLEVDLEDPS